ncbi:MAG: potassium channel protein [Synergistetes bacterium]|nr:potassium channel protein [Synergistota bacterium]MCX8127484.1 potassium channel protein [Synergistota bacterium]MDW8192739.1 potassium channel protein [Synergistota bacterium]
MTGKVKSPMYGLLVILGAIITGGTLGYTLIEGWTLFDSLYMTVITITTTGYKEVGELSIAGKVFSMILMFLGIGVFFYTLNTIIPIVIERREERWRNLLKRMENHCIVCGFGRTGHEIAKKLPKENLVIVDNDINKITIARELGLIAIHGDSTEEEVLEMAGVNKAKTLIACTDKDSSNAFTIIIAKDLNPKIHTIAVLRNPSGKSKLKRAGVDLILSPYEDIARKVSIAIQNPELADFIEIASKKESLIIRKIELLKTPLIGKSLEEIDLRKKTGCTVIAIERNGDIFLPNPKTSLKEGDIIYIIGSEGELCNLREILSDSL